MYAAIKAALNRVRATPYQGADREGQVRVRRLDANYIQKLNKRPSSQGPRVHEAGSFGRYLCTTHVSATILGEGAYTAALPDWIGPEHAHQVSFIELMQSQLSKQAFART